MSGWEKTNSSGGRPLASVAQVFVSWEDAKRIACLPSVDGMIHALVNDATEDNAICLVREIMERSRR